LLIKELSAEGIKLNVTALMTPLQVESVKGALTPEVPAVVSVFAGRVADTGRDPVPLMEECVKILSDHAEFELLWASPRELLNIFQADAIGCDIITVTPDLLKKLESVGKDLDQFSVETVQMFFRDAAAAGFSV
jgi:transaldolase